MMKFITSVLVAASLLTLTTRQVRARTSSYYGDSAAMTGASGMALYRGCGSVWYNPAGIVGNARGQIDLSASAFVFRIRDSTGLLTTRLPGANHVANLEAVSIQTVPSAVVFKRKLAKKLHGALVILVTDLETYHLDDEMSQRAGAHTYNQRTSIDQILQTYHFGFTLGWEISRRFRMGWSLFVVYSTFSYEFRAITSAYTSQDPSTGATLDPYLLLDNSSAETSLWGLQPSMGIQWQMSKSWHLGLMVRAPVIELKEEREARWHLDAVMYEEIGLGGGLHLNQPLTTTVGELVSPMQVVLGLAVKKKFYWFGLEGDITLPVKNYQEYLTDEAGDKLPPQINVRFGARFFVAKRVALGFGLFTERSLRRKPHVDFPGDSIFDYYGATFGIKWRTAHTVQKVLRKDGLVLTTTIGLRYAYGTGKMTTMSNDLRNLDNVVLDISESPRTVHELGLYIGSSLYF